MVDREEHLAWCKKRALEYLDRSDVANAITSMLSDLQKHPETKTDNKFLTVMGLMAIKEHDIAAARRFIEGFR